jgi:hypothetical protein
MDRTNILNSIPPINEIQSYYPHVFKTLVLGSWF